MTVPFLEAPRFPDIVGGLALGGPSFSTSIVALKSGHEQRNQNWSSGRGQWEFPAALEEVRHSAAVIAFFRVVKGRAFAFRFRDPLDNAVTTTTGTVRRISAGVYQLTKTYALGGLSDVRDIVKPDRFDVVVYVDGDPDTTAVLDSTTGVLALTSDHPAANVSWAGSFDVPCRFVSDELKIGYNSGGLLDWTSVSLLEIME